MLPKLRKMVRDIDKLNLELGFELGDYEIHNELPAAK